MILPSPSPLHRPAAADVARAVARHFWYRGYACLCEVPLANGRRADVVAIGPKAEIALVEIKVSAADLLGDTKWPDYLGHCDAFFWAVPPGRLADLAQTASFAPERTGLIVADGYEAAVLRPATEATLSPARRRAMLLAFARLGAARAMRAADPAFSPAVSGAFVGS
jgi:hypothetical protein